ncbi:hypothetical protein K6119_09425 [Paracrocinitomix mangrovi]|uniref:hypothetical protein n=1 Tax=Paracrocinitomix mangrovi TaxID=2862509 RepID=UPI001C8E9843|nr:hypothetical protein [Paracrocinitomix mangrovi]UKN03710.1 hypothetical protein K6119_09425 [Paracrocinitomix mangrovi]
MNKLISILSLTFLLISCSQEFDIKGSWMITSQEKIDEPPLMPSDHEFDLMDFIKPPIWSNCNGKKFEFTNNGEVHTNMLPDSVLQNRNFKYEYDPKYKNLHFFVTHPMTVDPTKMNASIEIISNSEMTWTLREYLVIKLKKE